MKLAVAIFLVFLISLAACAWPTIVGRTPIPSVHDEFANLLAADTFAHGRLTNPPLPESKYFETFHELMQPTYMSKFPPAQGLVLAAGELLGNPIIGSFTVMAFAAGLMVWTARACLPFKYAVFVGLIAATHPMLQWWAQGYWGGNVATAAGVLLLGCALRMRRRPRVGPTLGAAIAVAVFLISRPLEGCIFSAFITLFLLAQWTSRRIQITQMVAAVGVASLVLLPTLFWIGYYNYRVTGAATRFPYSLYTERYQVAPLLFWQPVNLKNTAVDSRPTEFANGYELKEYQDQTTWRGYFKIAELKLSEIFDYWVSPRSMLVLLLFVLPVLPNRQVRWLLLLCCGLPITLLVITPWMRMHYLAPAAGAYFLLLGFGAQQLGRWRVGRIALLVILLYNVWFIGNTVAEEVHNARPSGWNRQHLLDQLTSLPGQQLVIVRYSGQQQLMFEWVFNPSNPMQAKVAFAHERGASTLSDLRHLFPNRRCWLLTVHATQFEIREIPSTAATLPSDNPD